MQELYDPRPSSPPEPQLFFKDEDELDEAIRQDFIDCLIEGLEKNDKDTAEYFLELIRNYRDEFATFICESAEREKTGWYKDFRGEFFLDCEVYVESGRRRVSR